MHACPLVPGPGWPPQPEQRCVHTQYPAHWFTHEMETGGIRLVTVLTCRVIRCILAPSRESAHMLGGRAYAEAASSLESHVPQWWTQSRTRQMPDCCDEHKTGGRTRGAGQTGVGCARQRHEQLHEGQPLMLSPGRPDLPGVGCGHHKSRLQHHEASRGREKAPQGPGCSTAGW